jgi:hypothetical protein
MPHRGCRPEGFRICGRRAQRATVNKTGKQGITQEDEEDGGIRKIRWVADETRRAWGKKIQKDEKC